MPPARRHRAASDLLTESSNRPPRPESPLSPKPPAAPRRSTARLRDTAGTPGNRPHIPRHPQTRPANATAACASAASLHLNPPHLAPSHPHIGRPRRASLKIDLQRTRAVKLPQRADPVPNTPEQNRELRTFHNLLFVLQFRRRQEFDANMRRRICTRAQIQRNRNQAIIRRRNQFRAPSLRSKSLTSQRPERLREILNRPPLGAKEIQIEPERFPCRDDLPVQMPRAKHKRPWPIRKSRRRTRLTPRCRGLEKPRITASRALRAIRHRHTLRRARDPAKREPQAAAQSISGLA